MKIVTALRLIKTLLILLGVFWCLIFFNSCTSPPTSNRISDDFYYFKSTEAAFALGDQAQFEFSNIDFVADRNGRLLVQYKKPNNSRVFFRLSEIGGEKFGEEYEISKLLKAENEFWSFSFSFVENGVSVVANRDGNLFYSRSAENLADWSVPVQINDEQGAFVSGLKFLQLNESDIFCVWTDKRRGVNLIFFSSSPDGGKSWSANQPIDYDFREGKQELPQLVVGENQRLLVFWQDWRDHHTLADIRYAYSDDKGVKWAPSQKVNDDENEVWQITPSVVADGSNVYTVFADFREHGEENDNDWNIYFARSTDNGATWEENRRLHDKWEGRDMVPFLAVDRAGNLYCLWRTTRNTLFGQISFSYSNDKGVTWSPAIALTKENEMVKDGFKPVAYVLSPDKLFVNWIMENDENQELSLFSILEKSSDLIVVDDQNSKEKTSETIIPIKFGVGKTLFVDHFSGETAEQWDASEGFWDISDETYSGVYPRKHLPYVSYAKFEEPERYVMQGRFKLDPVAHTAASFYFRTNETGKRHYVITNFFRHGAWLSLKDNDLPSGLHISGGQPLVQKRFPFKSDTWYKFTLVVTPEQVDYYVDGRLMLSYKGNLILPKGKIGIGGFFASPTYFDDISISELER